jgi:hypothetical protein
MYGPTGVGVVYGKRERLETLEPYMFGGDMIKQVTFEKATWHDIPWKFEAGTPNIAGAIGLAAAVQFIESIGFDKIQENERKLNLYALEELRKISGLEIIGPQENRVGVISFALNSIHSHDIATILDQNNVAVRAGHHCTMPLMQYLGLSGTTRASFGMYNTMEDVETVRIFVVPALMIDCKSVEVETPFTIEVSIVPDAVKLLELIIEEVEIDPPMLDVIVLDADDNVFGTSKLVTDKLVVVPEFAVKVLSDAVFVDVRLAVVRLVPVALSKIKDDM